MLHFNDGYFIQNKVPSSLMANVEDVNGCGYGDNSDTNYGFFEYKTFDNRYYILHVYYIICNYIIFYIYPYILF